MQQVVIAKPYQFAPPHHGTFWPWLLQKWLPGHTRRKWGIEGLEFHGLEPPPGVAKGRAWRNPGSEPLPALRPVHPHVARGRTAPALLYHGERTFIHDKAAFSVGSSAARGSSASFEKAWIAKPSKPRHKSWWMLAGRW